MTGDKVFIDVGWHAATPSISGLAEARPSTHIEALDLDDAPSHLIVLVPATSAGNWRRATAASPAG